MKFKNATLKCCSLSNPCPNRQLPKLLKLTHWMDESNDIILGFEHEMMKENETGMNLTKDINNWFYKDEEVTSSKHQQLQ
ncbi:hypothetical protein Glove_320g201 [Diversispora epigaea]|uniref:Uncharacterized protein n=1 Tax=Diversispora epigaea TaxID=1348612 RepID=A0A397HTZ8_9GLOM|nr:hypothetical protein Glove_320g201 [Diversispora epigaea]